MVTLHVPVAFVHAPFQPPKVDELAADGVAVSTTTCPEL
jgi:hypothetical protein